MQQRTRALIPVLPRLVTTARENLDHARRLLDTVRDARPGQQFVIDGIRFECACRERSKWQSGTLYVTRPTNWDYGSTPYGWRTTRSGPGPRSLLTLRVPPPRCNYAVGGMTGYGPSAWGDHLPVRELWDLTGRWWDWQVEIWNSSMLRLIADDDLTYHHLVEV